MPISSEPQSGVIDPAQLYTITAFKRRLGIRDATLRAARRAGLRVNYVHKQAYILGEDWISYVLQAGGSRNDRPASGIAMADALDQAS